MSKFACSNQVQCQQDRHWCVKTSMLHTCDELVNRTGSIEPAVIYSFNILVITKRKHRSRFLFSEALSKFFFNCCFSQEDLSYIGDCGCAEGLLRVRRTWGSLLQPHDSFRTFRENQNVFRICRGMWENQDTTTETKGIDGLYRDWIFNINNVKTSCWGGIEEDDESAHRSFPQCHESKFDTKIIERDI